MQNVSNSVWQLFKMVHKQYVKQSHKFGHPLKMKIQNGGRHQGATFTNRSKIPNLANPKMMLDGRPRAALSRQHHEREIVNTRLVRSVYIHICCVFVVVGVYVICSFRGTRALGILLIWCESLRAPMLLGRRRQASHRGNACR
jgi:hypothetical protein